MRIGRRAFVGFIGGSVLAGFTQGSSPLSITLEADGFRYISTEVVPEYYVRDYTRLHRYPSWATESPSLRTRRVLNIIGEELPNLINDQLMNIAETQKLGDILPLIAERITPGRTGYLLRVNTALFENTRYVSGNLIEAVGVGREPIDALAEAKLHGEIRSTPIKGSSDTRYLWCTLDGPNFKIVCVDVALVSALERQASAEARRRLITGGGGINDIGREIEKIERSTYWKALSDERMKEIKEVADKIRIEKLNRRFESSQQRCNELYLQFQQISAELAAQNSEAALINKIGAILSGVKAGLQAIDQYVGSVRSSDASDSAWREHQVSVLQDASTSTANSFNSYAEELRTLDQSLNSEWDRMQVDWEKTSLRIPRFP